MKSSSVAVSIENTEVKFLEPFEIDRLKNMVKESAIMMMATILNVEYHHAESLYNLMFK